MSDEPRTSSKYVRFIDLSARAVAAERARAAREALESSEEVLPPITADELPERAARALDNAGWPSLTPVQEQTIPYVLAERDLIVQSRTGSGKTGAFLLPLFDRLDSSKKAVQALVLTPTRELARQVEQEFERMRGRDEGAPRAVLVYGGVKYGPQIDALKSGAQLVVGTPGRILDLLERKHMSLASLETLVFDEADEMLSMGFYPAMQALKRFLPEDRNTYMFSATIPIRVQNLASEFLRDPGFLGLSAGDESVETSQHRYYLVEPMSRDRALVSLLEMENPDSAIIFANTKRDVEYLTAFLQNYGHDADSISGDLTQRDREDVMRRLKNGSLRFLVATDVAARGIDVSELDFVFMYDVPQNPEYYIHRSGRTARAGRAGTVIVLATFLEHSALLSIARRYGVELEKRELPSEDAVAACVAERMTVLLEDLYRKKKGVQRERLRRFIGMAEQLAEEEPELLAMLIDKVYHDSMHVRMPDEGTEPERSGEAKPKKPGKGARGGGGRSRGRGDSRRRGKK